jgi:hypothetical protein
VKKRLRHSVVPGIVLGEFGVLGGNQALGRLHGAVRRKVRAWLEPGLPWRRVCQAKAVQPVSSAGT